MSVRVNHSDLGAGLILAGSSAAFLYLARDLDHGSALAMGPGFFPRYVAGIGLLIGLLLFIKAFKTTSSLPPLRLRPLLFILASVFLFGQLVHVLGLAVTAFCTIITAGLADRHWRPVQLLGTAVVVTAGACMVFVKLLGVPLPLWPTF